MLVGDTKAPLLRIVDRPSDIKGIEHNIMNPVQYVPLQKKCFDTVTVSIMLDSGNPVPFLAGKNGGGFRISSSCTQLFFYIKALPIEWMRHSTLRP